MAICKKPMLSVDEQIKRLMNNGIQFEKISIEGAKRYLSNNNNYFKLTSYRKNFIKDQCGRRAGKYIDLDFAYLKDLAIIDMRLRYLLLEMALDIEHYAKLKLLHEIENSTEDGYQIVADYMESLKPTDPEEPDHYKQLCHELSRNRGNPYCGNMIKKYDGNYPVWVFIEVIPFGRFAYFYQFCAERLGNKHMHNESYLLLDIRMLRNACAHNNCILNDLIPTELEKKANLRVLSKLSEAGITKDVRKRKMSNIRVRQITTLLYLHSEIVTSEGVHKAVAKKLHEMTRRMIEHNEYYKNNDTVRTTMEFFKKVVDCWFE
ncbi:MAG: Abi family protein [Clostridiales bacterium]|nr:Abi family protein [Clostridiales bacterium]